MLKKVKYHIGNYLPALRSPNYRLYFFGQGISLLGTWMASVAEQWLVYPTLTNNQAMLGIASMLNLIPTTLFVLFAGVFADHANKRITVVITQSVFAIISFALSILVFTHAIQLWHVLLATFIAGTVFALDMPVRNVLMLQLVNREDYPSAVSLNSGIFNAARALGPALAGFAIAAIGIAPAYFLNAISFLAVIGSILAMKLPHHVPPLNRPSLFKGLREALLHFKQNKVFVLVLLLIAAQTLFTWPMNVLTPVFAHDIYNVGELGFGLMVSMFGIGAVIGAFGFSYIYHTFKNTFGLLLATVNLSILTVIAFALIPSFHVTLIVLVLGGWAIATFVNLTATIVQISAPDHLRGRVSSVYSLVLLGPMPFGALFASWFVGRLGPRYTVAFGAALFAICAYAVFSFFGSRMKIRLNALHD